MHVFFSLWSTCDGTVNVFVIGKAGNTCSSKIENNDWLYICCGVSAVWLNSSDPLNLCHRCTLFPFLSFIADKTFHPLLSQTFHSLLESSSRLSFNFCVVYFLDMSTSVFRWLFFLSVYVPTTTQSFCLYWISCKLSSSITVPLLFVNLLCSSYLILYGPVSWLLCCQNLHCLFISGNEAYCLYYVYVNHL